MAEIPSIQEQVQKAVFHLGASKTCLIGLFYHIYVFVHNSEVPTHDPYGIMASICSQLVNTVKSRFHANFHKYFGYHPNFCCFHCHIELFGYLMAKSPHFSEPIWPMEARDRWSKIKSTLFRVSSIGRPQLELAMVSSFKGQRLIFVGLEIITVMMIISSGHLT
jgi:hypothetical protein